MRARLVTLGLLALAAGCAAPGPLDPTARAVAPQQETRVWRPASPEDLDGLFSSIEIEGPAAAVLRELHYWFAADGSFSGAALVVVPAPTFQTLTGRWRLADGQLELGEDTAPARAEVAGDLLALTGPEGSVVLRKRALP